MDKERFKIADSPDSEVRRGLAGSLEKIASAAADLAEQVCEAEGIELVHAEFQRESGGRILRLYIDKPGGVTLDDCVRISRQTSELLDVDLDIKIPYSLEVSSPGPDRPIGKMSDFNRFQGSIVKIQTRRPLDGRKNFTGVLLGLSEGEVRLLVDGKTVGVSEDNIQRARLVNYRGENKCL